MLGSDFASSTKSPESRRAASAPRPFACPATAVKLWAVDTRASMFCSSVGGGDTSVALIDGLSSSAASWISARFWSWSGGMSRLSVST